jgi:hypothetical protein
MKAVAETYRKTLSFLTYLKLWPTANWPIGWVQSKKLLFVPTRERSCRERLRNHPRKGTNIRMLDSDFACKLLT